MTGSLSVPSEPANRMLLSDHHLLDYSEFRINERSNLSLTTKGTSENRGAKIQRRTI